MQQSTKRSWYLIYTKARNESVAEENLQRQGYDCYLPMVKNSRLRNTRFIKIIEPLFPRYLFIELSMVSDNWSPIRSTLGVAKIVSFGNTPAIIADNLIITLKNNENSEGLQTIKNNDLKNGDKVEILSGPLQGYEGIFAGYSANDRVNILLDIIGKQSKLQLDAFQIYARNKSANV